MLREELVDHVDRTPWRDVASELARRVDSAETLRLRPTGAPSIIAA